MSRDAAPRIDGERGSVTAELAIALPTVVIVLAACLSGMQLAGQHLIVQDAAAAAARSAARGDSPGAIAAQLVPGSSASQSAKGDLVCVTVSAPGLAVALRGLTVSASSCALGGGR